MHVSWAARVILPIPMWSLGESSVPRVFTQTISAFGTNPHARTTRSASSGIDATRQSKRSASSAIRGSGNPHTSSAVIVS